MARTPKVRRLPEVDDSAFGDAAFDYADAFEVRAITPDERTMESLARAALEDVPLALRVVILAAHRFVLRFRLGPLSSVAHVLGWRIVTSAPDCVVLEADGPLIRGVMVGRRSGPSVTVLETFVFYHQPAARPVWTVVGVLHRRIAPILLRRAAAAR